MRIRLALAVVVLAQSATAVGATPCDPRAILEQAVATAGGDNWLAPRSVVLSGTAEFYAPDRADPVSRSDDYRMWRALDPNRTAAHAADGKVRITARSGGKVLFEVGFDGVTTWNDKGVVPPKEAAAMWASNFGFGIIRRALGEGFTLECAPARTVDDHRLDLVRVIDPAGAPTLFGIDRHSRFIRYMGFASPRGWHERTYDDFVMQAEPRWLQPRLVTLYYNGVKANVVRWTEFEVGVPIRDATFAWPGTTGGKQ